MGNAEAVSMLPREIDDLADLDIVDVSVGDSHCLALVIISLKNRVVLE
jgi:hypothetical protein